MDCQRTRGKKDYDVATKIKIKRSSQREFLYLDIHKHIMKVSKEQVKRYTNKSVPKDILIKMMKNTEKEFKKPVRSEKKMS